MYIVCWRLLSDNSLSDDALKFAYIAIDPIARKTAPSIKKIDPDTPSPLPLKMKEAGNEAVAPARK